MNCTKSVPNKKVNKSVKKVQTRLYKNQIESIQMIGLAMYTTILTLHKQNVSQRQISKMTNTHRKTVKKIITRYEKEKIEASVPYVRESLVNSWHEQIINLLSSNLSMIRIYESCDYLINLINNKIQNL